VKEAVSPGKGGSKKKRACVLGGIIHACGSAIVSQRRYMALGLYLALEGEGRPMAAICLRKNRRSSRALSNNTDEEEGGLE